MLNRFQSSEAYHPPATSYAQPISAREWPTLTLYRDGLANLNALATELLRAVTHVALVEPAPVQRGRLPKAWQLHGNTGADGLPLIAHGTRVTTRFRAPLSARLLFADLPAEVERLSFVLTPEPGHAQRFRLLPV